jgi:ribosomal protein S18 acetylase RimI-like enzyme
MVIIEANVSHAAAIATIGKKSFRKAFKNTFNSREELHEYLEYTYDPVKLARSLRKAGNVYFVALINNEPVGFAKIKLSSLNEHIETVSQMELQKIYVLPAYHGLGVGTALLNEVKRVAHDQHVDYLWLDVVMTNEKGIHFYERNGFGRMGRYFFTIGTQRFEYHVMGLPVAIAIKTAC